MLNSSLMEPENPNSPSKARPEDKKGDKLSALPWMSLYEGALLEFDSQKLIERISVAESAISKRLHDLRSDSNHHDERQLMRDAQSALEFLRRSASGAS